LLTEVVQTHMNSQYIRLNLKETAFAKESNKWHPSRKASISEDSAFDEMVDYKPEPY